MHHQWGIILAAGEGVRLRSVTADQRGVPVPKQFCAFRGRQSMLRCALERAERVIPRERILVVVSPAHHMWWEHELADRPPRNVLVQPSNRGTAVGVLFPLIEIIRRDAAAAVRIFPSDHYVEDETILQAALEDVMERARWQADRVILLGMAPEGPDPDYGWIVPASDDPGPIVEVAAFVEKPTVERAAQLQREDALWNSFMLWSPGHLLLRLYLEHLSEVASLFLRRLERMAPEVWDPSELESVYRVLPKRDFSRDLLEPAVHDLAVFRVPPCGWSDLGTPERVVQCLARVRNDPSPEAWSPRPGERLLMVPESLVA